MSDLMSRSELLKEIKSLSIVLSGKQIFSDDAKDTVLRIINEQPTAYSVDKVVADIMEAYGCHNCEQVDTMACNECAELDVLNDICEIVKQGGVSDDVCEWKAIGANDNWSTSCDKNSTHNVFGVAWFKRCPYCGKKIKVVE